MNEVVGFSLDDVLELAQQMERNGAEFYRAAAAAADTVEKRNMFLGLAGMEEQHERAFAKARSELKGKVDPEADAAIAGYLRAWVDGEVFDRAERFTAFV